MGKLGRNFGSLSITLLLLVFEQGVLCLESPNIFLVLDITSDNLMQGIDLVSSRSSSFHLIKSINHLRFFVHSFFVHSFFVHPFFRPAVLSSDAVPFNLSPSPSLFPSRASVPFLLWFVTPGGQFGLQ
jgi:hypothetical protein